MTSTVLFGSPQQEVASVIAERMARASAISIVTGFASPGGLAVLEKSIKASPGKLESLTIGAGTYAAFETLDSLLAYGVRSDSLRIHLGHTKLTRGRKNPFARYHPMLHSKVYYMEFPDRSACALVGSHNLTAYALTGLNGEAAVLLEGPRDSGEFAKIREHVALARQQAQPYSQDMKEGYAWWTREFLDGWKAKIDIPQEGEAVRTVLLFAGARAALRPRVGEHLYFELPSGIEQIESFKTEAHLFLFDSLPPDPRQALYLASSADSSYTCIVVGIENKQGNRELAAEWRISGTPKPALTAVPDATYRPVPSSGMQQVRAEIKGLTVPEYEYLFERESSQWHPEFAERGELHVPVDRLEPRVLSEALGGYSDSDTWRLVKNLTRRGEAAAERDAAALRQATPESGAFALVSLRRRQRRL